MGQDVEKRILRLPGDVAASAQWRAPIPAQLLTGFSGTAETPTGRVRGAASPPKDGGSQGARTS
eukprot:12889426-Alexandrium_andersonii.AAC.3